MSGGEGEVGLDPRVGHEREQHTRHVQGVLLLGGALWEQEEGQPERSKEGSMSLHLQGPAAKSPRVIGACGKGLFGENG